MRDVQTNGPSCRTFANHDIEGEVFHRRIQDLLDLTVKAMDLVDEQHVTRLQVGEDRRKIARTGDGGSGSRLDLRAHLIRDDRRQRGLSQAGGTGEYHVVKTLAACLSRLDENLQTLLDVLLPAIVIETLRTQAALGIEIIGGKLTSHEALTLPMGIPRRRRIGP